MPSSTPCGMLTDSVFSLRTRPAPEHVEHGLSMTWPAPPQDEQVRSMVKKPCWLRTLPRPWQERHAVGRLPGAAPAPPQLSHSTEVGTLIRVSRPR